MALLTFCWWIYYVYSFSFSTVEITRKFWWLTILLQIVIWFIIPATRNKRANHNNNALALIVLIQYVPRLYLIFPLSSQIIKATGLVTKTAWAGAAYNLLLYMLASHVSISDFLNVFCNGLLFQLVMHTSRLF